MFGEVEHGRCRPAVWEFSAMFADDKDRGRMTPSVVSVPSNKRVLFKLHRAQLIYRGEGKVGEVVQPPNTCLSGMCLLKNFCQLIGCKNEVWPGDKRYLHKGIWVLILEDSLYVGYPSPALIGVSATLNRLALPRHLQIVLMPGYREKAWES